MTSPEKRLVRSKSGLRIMHVKDSERSPFELSEPEWIKDSQCSACLGCKSNFYITRRKHHCRRCGQIYCNACSKWKLALPRMCFLDPVRLCSPCADITEEENLFYEKDIKELTTGVVLDVKYILPDSNPDDSQVNSLHCCLSPNHCSLKVSGDTPQLIPMTSITVISNSENDENDNKTLNNLSFIVTGDSTITELRAPPNNSSTAPSFLWSLQKALQMTDEARAVIGIGK